MTRFILAAILAIFPTKVLFGAIAATTVWEINGAGSLNVSAGFNPSNANMATDLTTDANTGNTASPVVSSATYNFVAGDVGHYLFVKAGTNWIPGWYQIASVASNKATLSAAIGAAQLVDYTDNTAAGVATVGTPTGGTWTIDYSRSTTARFSGTDLECADGDAAAPIITSASAAFGQSHIGNLILISSGANWTLNHYEIISVTGTNATLDRAVGTDGAKTSGTFWVGGAASMLSASTGRYPSQAITGSNRVWVTGTITPDTTNQSFAGTGTASAPSILEGYKTKRGDGFLGRNGSGGLITTNFPTFSFTGSQRFNASTTYGIVKNLYITAACDNSALSVASGSNNIILNCAVTNSSTGSGAIAISIANSNNYVFNSDATLTGGFGGSSAINGSSGLRVVGCRVKGGPAIGITASSGLDIINCLIYDCGSHGIDFTTTTPTGTIFGNTIVNCGGNGIDVLDNTTTTIIFVNNMITDCAGYGIDLNTAGTAASIIHCRFRDNSSGNIGFGGSLSDNTSFGNVTTDGDAFSDYTNEASDNFVPLSTSPAINAGLLETTIGALQRDQSGSGSGGQRAHTFVQ